MKKVDAAAEAKARHLARYQASPMEDKLIHNLYGLAQTLKNLYEGRGSQKQVLMTLLEAEPTITQQQLTRRLGIQPGSASEVIAKLEAAGSVRRTPNENDRRTVNVALTEEGRRLAQEAMDAHNQRHKTMFSCFTAEEQQNLLSLLEHLSAYWEETYDSSKPE